MKARSLALLAGIAAVCMIAALGGTSASAAKRANDTLQLAFYADMVTVDPDVFYDIEGDAVSLSVYDGLLRYKPGTTKLTGALASRWSVSKGATVYTFELRPNARFSDGTRVTSKAVETSFERRTAVNQGPAYMLADVKRYRTPDARTFVVVLKKPVADFADLMASVWGPKVINPRVLAAHAKDHAQAYLKTHAAGTGAFSLTSFRQGTGYVLTRNPYYWGPKPFFAKVEISIIPDVSTQLLKLQRGDLDAILHGFPLANLDAIKGNKDLKTYTFPSLGTTTLYLNFNKPALKSRAVRRAVVQALDVPDLVREVWGDTATVPAGAYPSPLVAPSLAPNDYRFSPAAIKAAIPKGLSLDVVYTPDSSGVQRRLGDLVRQKLAAFGVNVKAHQVDLSVVYGYRDHVRNAADIYLSTPTPDAAHPDAWGRIVWYTKGGLNFFNYSNKRVDSALDQGLRSRSAAAAIRDYGRAGRAANADWTTAPIAQVKDLVVARASLKGVTHVPAYPWTIDLARLSR